MIDLLVRLGATGLVMALMALGLWLVYVAIVSAHRAFQSRAMRALEIRQAQLDASWRLSQLSREAFAEMLNAARSVRSERSEP